MRTASKAFDLTQDPTLNARAAAVRRKQTAAKIAAAVGRLGTCVFQQGLNDAEIALGQGSLNARLYLKRQERKIREEIATLESN